MDKSTGRYEVGSPRQGRRMDADGAISNAIRDDGQPVGLGFCASVRDLAKHEHAPKMSFDLARLTVRGLNRALKTVVAKASKPIRAIAISSSHEPRRLVRFAFQGCDKAHARTLARLLPKEWGKRIWTKETDGSWTLTIRIIKDSRFVGWEQALADAGRRGFQNVVCSCQCLDINDLDFCKLLKKQSELVSVLFQGNIRFEKRDGAAEFGTSNRVELARFFKAALEEGHDMMAYNFAQNLIKPSPHSSLGREGYREILEAFQAILFRNLPGTEKYLHLDLSNLFIMWFLKNMDPLSAAKVLMDRMDRGIGLVPELTKVVTKRLVDYRIANPGCTIGDLRSQHPESAAVQQWLDIVASECAARALATNDVELAHTALAPSSDKLRSTTTVAPLRVGPLQFQEFCDMFESGDALSAWAFAQELLNARGTPEQIGQSFHAYRFIMQYMQQLPEMKPYRHFGDDLGDLFMVWFLSANEPLSAAEVLMSRIAKHAQFDERPSDGPFGGPMEEAVTQRLVDYLKANRDHSVDALREKHPWSTPVQRWLDTVEAKLPH